MIEVTRLHGKKVLVNEDLIQRVESIPDTLLTFTTGEKMMVLEPPDQVIEAVVQFKRRIFIHSLEHREVLEKES